MKIKTFKGGYDDNFTYVIYNEKKCCIIDPAVPAKGILDWIIGHNLQLQFVVMMHSHHDHIVDLDVYKNEHIKVLGHSSTKVAVTKKLDEGDEIGFDDVKFKVMHTPGHIYDCICLLLNDKILFTSDTLFVEGCGRVDFAGSEPKKMVITLNRLKNLPDEVEVYPGHDYGSTPNSTIGREKERNRFFSFNKEEFMKDRLG